MSGGPASRRPTADIVLLVLIAAAWANALGGAFQWDDYKVIVDNPRVHGLRAWAQALPSGIRPVLALSYTLNWLSGAGAAGFHAVNLVVHAANALLVLRLVRGVAGGTPALLTAFVFALHPIQTEAVTYVSGRSAALAAFFQLAGLLAWRADRRLAALGAFILAAGSKETAVTWPAAIVLCEVGAGRSFGGALRRAAPAWAVAAALLGFLAASSRYRALLDFSLALRGPLENLPSQVAAVGYLLSRLVLVHRLTIDPALAAPVSWTPALAAGGAAILATTALAVAVRRRHPAPCFAVLWLVLHLLPTNSVIARADVVAERQMYLAAVGPALLAALAVAALPGRAASRVVAALLVGVLGGATHLRNRDYRSEIALWAAATRVTPHNARAFSNLGWAWQLDGCVPQAHAAYLEALRLRPDYPRARANLTALEAAAPGLVCRPPS